MGADERARAVERVLDVIAPRYPGPNDERIAIFEWGKETSPTLEEMQDLAEKIVDAVVSST